MPALITLLNDHNASNATLNSTLAAVPTATATPGLDQITVFDHIYYIVVFIAFYTCIIFSCMVGIRKRNSHQVSLQKNWFKEMFASR